MTERQQSKAQAFKEWLAATEKLAHAVFAPEGQQSPDIHAQRALLTDLQKKKAAFKATFDL